MRKYVLLGVFAAILVVSVAVSVSDDSSAEICDNVRVYVQKPFAADGASPEEKYELATVGGVQTVKGAVDKAMEQLGRSYELNPTGAQILKVDGFKPDEDHYWRLFQWLPEGTSGWGIQGFNTASDGKMVTGTSYCLSISTRSDKDGSPVYSPPDFQPKSTGYIFIRFANGFSPDNEHIQKVFTPEIRAKGFWLEGYGSNMAEVLADAVNRNWPGEIDQYSGNTGGQDISGWISNMFGLGNQNLGEDVWAYWSQWTWQNHQWGYNNLTMGYYDPAVYHYLECIYLISTPDPYGGSFAIDKGGQEPNPETEEIVCLKNKLNVVFRLQDGTQVATQTVDYGKSIDVSKVTPPEIEGMGFQGWGDTTAPVYTDLTFTAKYTQRTDEMLCVTYRSQDGSFIWNDYVLPGKAATYSGVPAKPSTEKFHYVFKGWSSDLSSVTENLTVTPEFDEKLRYYDVYFYNHDRTLISKVSVGYGMKADKPDIPSRESTVMYSYVFDSWSLTPNWGVSVDLDHITGTTYVFAYYKPVARDYTVTFVEDGKTVGAYTVKYGNVIGGTYSLDIFKGKALAKMYRDVSFSEEYSTDYVIIGDTTVYVKRIPGSYDSERDEGGNVTGKVVKVSFTEDLAHSLRSSGGSYVICDISQFSDGTAASIGKDSLLRLSSVLGSDAKVTVMAPRGSITMRISDLVSVCGDNGSISFSVGNGPSGIGVSTALKKINYNMFYRVILKSGNQTVMELPEGTEATVSLQLRIPDNLPAAVWNITSSGATKRIDCSYDGRYASFETGLLQFYAVGTTGTVIVRETVVTPYGETVVSLDGSGLNGHATLVSMKLDNMGGVLFVPSSLNGCTLRTVSGGAFNGVTNAAHLVIPCTVSQFSWNNWANKGISDVYFLGNRPSFEGTVPAGVTVHRSASASGWDSDSASNDLAIRTYDGSYGKDVFYFDYYVVDGKIVVYRYIGGPYISIPESIMVDGTPCPVTYVGDGAFMFSKDKDIIELYGLKYKFYDLHTVELKSIKEVHTRAFLNSPIKDVLLMEQVEHIWDEAFGNCVNLTNVKFSDGLVFIGESAFRGCVGKAFTRIAVPDNVRVIGKYAFAECTSITRVALGKGVTEIPAYCFSQCVKMTEINISASVLRIGEGAFYNCTGLMFVDLNNVESVGDKAFFTESGSVLGFVVFGKNLKVLGKDSFSNSFSLKEIEVHCKRFDSFEQAFANVDTGKITLYVSNDFMNSWNGFNVQPLEEITEDRDNSLLLCVEVGLIVMFIVLGIASLKIRTRSQ